MSKRLAIIVGHQGQDGRLLTELLISRGYGVLGVGRSSVETFGPIIATNPCRLDDASSISGAVADLEPDEVYYLAAHHASSETRDSGDLRAEYLASVAVNVTGLLHFLEAIRNHSPRTRLFYASTSLIFGNQPVQSPQTETTPRAPEEAYAILKLLGGNACREYRERHGVFASVGILFNHESRWRSPKFLSRKIAKAAAAAKAQGRPSLGITLGNLDATVDWGYAPDFVDAFTRILALDRPDDFIVATGIAHTVRDFAAAAFGCVGLDWRDHVAVDASLIAQPRTGRMGDAGKLRRLTAWAPSVTFDEMARLLVEQAEAAS